ncbi:hypothetical protein SPFL3102_02654 [Sporomusaceae bacterium FL31]|nr:hypothetical protein SPFL3101_02629 [Sporomusaceae bacterium FL31]GCE34827.1 hypothetical protein SPFL3102_02654 [Sporomusaceae bacterium]
MDKYLTPDEVGNLLRVSEAVIIDCLSSGTLPGIKLGNLWRIPSVRLEKFLESSMQYKEKVHVEKKALPRPEQQKQDKNVEYFSCDEVAERYGVKKITVWFWIREKKLNAIQTGKNYRIRMEDLKEFDDNRMTQRTSIC